MKKKGLETLVLVIGLMVIGSAVFFIFITDDRTGSTIYITNLIISVGFLIYVIYSILSGNNLNREIRLLNKHVESLKEEIGKQKKQIAERDATISQRNTELSEKSAELEDASTKIHSLETTVKELQAEINKAE